jgi:hypothetical protein
MSKRKSKCQQIRGRFTVEEVSTDSLVPYANNAKIHTNEQIDQICASIGEFGFNDPVAVWDGPEGTEIVEGHGRVMAAKRLGLETLPVIRLDHLTDEQRRAYTHVHNQLTMSTGWDFERLEADLEALDFDFGGFGFEEAESFDVDDFGQDFQLNDSDEPLSKTITLQLSNEQYLCVEEAMRNVGTVPGEGNKAGNAIAEVCRQWVAL